MVNKVTSLGFKGAIVLMDTVHVSTDSQNSKCKEMVRTIVLDLKRSTCSQTSSNCRVFECEVA